MESQVKNISFCGQPIEIRVESGYLLLIDPLAVDGLSMKLSSLPNPGTLNLMDFAAQYSGLSRIGIYEIPDFVPGNYQLSAGDLVAVDPDERGPEIVDIDSADLLIVDLDHLRVVAETLTWNQYDLILASPLNDNTEELAVIEKIGGPYFGILGPDSNTQFVGDGSYKIRPGALRRLPD